MNNKTIWSLEQTAAELNLTVDEARSKLADIPSHKGEYFVEDIFDALTPSLSALRKAERTARTDYIEFRNQILKGERIESAPLEKAVGEIVHNTIWMIRASAASSEQKAELQELLHECASSLAPLEEKYAEERV